MASAVTRKDISGLYKRLNEIEDAIDLLQGKMSHSHDLGYHEANQQQVKAIHKRVNSISTSTTLVLIFQIAVIVGVVFWYKW